MIKSFFRSLAFQTFLGWLIAVYMWLIARTVRWDIEGEEFIQKAWDSDEGFVLAFWHSRIAIAPVIALRLQKKWLRSDQNPAVIISNSKDGEFVARASQHLGIVTIRGSAKNRKKASKDKGGIEALREANRLLAEGGCVCLTPDGPRGPREHASLGAVRIAQRAHAEIVVFAAAASPATRLKSWDRTLLPRPFGRGKLIFSAPIDAPRDADAERIRERLEMEMRTLNERAELEAGLSLVPRPEVNAKASKADAAAS